MNGRILALLGNSFNAPGGIAQFNRDLISAWSEMDSVKEVVLLPRFSSGSSLGVPSKVVERVAVSNLVVYVLRAVLASIRRPSFDIIFCGHLNMIPLAVSLSKLSGAPVWLQLHGIEAWTQPSRAVGWMTKKVALTTSVSRHTRRRFLSWADLESQRALVLPNTVGEQFTPDGCEGSVAGNYGLSEKRIMLSVSRLTRLDGYKGQDKVIRCMPDLCREFDDLVYVIVGEGDLRKDLEQLAESLQVDHAVIFLGPVRHEELPSLYRDASVFVMPSTGEGFGIVFLESIACGTPVIAGDRDGARDPLQDGALGMLSSEEQLGTAIRSALKSDCSASERDDLNARRAESVVHHFGRPAFYTNIASITDRMLGKHYETPSAACSQH